jgi:hypothetical protein
VSREERKVMVAPDRPGLRVDDPNANLAEVATLSGFAD